MSLGNLALTGLFPVRGGEVPRAKLELVRCAEGCGLVQLRETYNLAAMYGMDYGYRSGLNAGMVKHLHALIGAIQLVVELRPGDLVVDIGSNDGTSLAAYPSDVRRVGVDPTGVKFKEYYRPGIELIPDFFSATRLQKLVGDQKAKIVTSFSMFYDLEDPLAFMKEVAGALADDGVWMMEQSYLPAMLHANAYDTICHEHLEYYALRQIEWMASRCGLEVVSAEESSTNGGSSIVLLAKSARPCNGRLVVAPNVAEMRTAEVMLDLQAPHLYEAFRLRSRAASDAIEGFLRYAKSAGLRVCGLGASTKGNVLLQMIPGVHDLISAIGDVNPDKWGCVTPGTQIPIRSEDAVLAENPDFLIVLPWHFRAGFLEKAKFKGHRLVFPLPQLEVVQL
jgi:NDP-4-keto-2,6-dideoxyhexose 3-C-methyltransferase